MKNPLLRFSTLLLLAGFALAGTPAFAVDLAAPLTGSALTNTEVSTTHAKLQKKTHKGFFGKIKSVGQKAKVLAKGIGAWAKGDHNLVVAILLTLLLGGFGIHRVYLGGRPLLILLYIITLGGIFGLLPLIDLIRLIIGHMSHYEDNDSFFAAFQ